MAELSRIMSNDVPFTANVPVFASATGLLLKGSVVSLITANTGTGTYFGLTSAADTAQAKKALGPLLISDAFASADKENNAQNSTAHRMGTSGIPNRGALTGYNWLPSCINSDQLNFILYDATTVNVCTGVSASTGTAVTVTAAEASVAGAWIFSTDSAASIVNTYTGSLRYVSAISAATGTFGLTTAMNVSTDSALLVIRPVNHRLTQLDTTGRFLMSTSAAGAGVSLHIYENYINHANAPMTALRFWVHDGLDGLNVKSARFYAEVMYLNHVYRSTLA